MICAELHLHDADRRIAKKYGNRIKEAGGKYTECRGRETTRFVTLPLQEFELINELVGSYRNDKYTCVILRARRWYRVLHVYHSTSLSLLIADELPGLFKALRDMTEGELEYALQYQQEAIERARVERLLFQAVGTCELPNKGPAVEIQTKRMQDAEAHRDSQDRRVADRTQAVLDLAKHEDALTRMFKPRSLGEGRKLEPDDPEALVHNFFNNQFTEE